MAKLSVNINKIATLRNARGGNLPNVKQFAIDCQAFGADGITIHPRPDERHITMADCFEIAETIVTEYNIEGFPDERYLSIIKEIKPTQATLVPDPPGVLTSNAGWDVSNQYETLKKHIETIKAWGVRVSVFVEPKEEDIERIAQLGADRIELYTGPYAEGYPLGDKSKEILPYQKACEKALTCGLGINAGHDLNLDNLAFFNHSLRQLDEVSIGHALLSDALYYGIENAIMLYKRCLH